MCGDLYRERGASGKGGKKAGSGQDSMPTSGNGERKDSLVDRICVLN
jgi:hypothetical protein